MFSISYSTSNNRCPIHFHKFLYITENSYKFYLKLLTFEFLSRAISSHTSHVPVTCKPSKRKVVQVQGSSRILTKEVERIPKWNNWCLLGWEELLSVLILLVWDYCLAIPLTWKHGKTFQNKGEFFLTKMLVLAILIDRKV